MKKEAKPNPKKALKFEAKGDKLVSKGKFREAIEHYKTSQSLNPDRAEIYEKLIETLNRFEHEWKEEDFANSMTWTMRHQEISNPQIKLVHETFSVEYKAVQQLVQRLMLAINEEVENRIIDDILRYGEHANLPMLHFILSLKSFAKNQDNPPQDTL